MRVMTREEEHWEIIFMRTLIKAGHAISATTKQQKIHCVYCCQRLGLLDRAAVITGTAVVGIGTEIILM